MGKTFVLLIVISLLLFPVASLATDNPFVSKEPPKKAIKSPSCLSKIYGKISLWQHQLNEKFARLSREIKTSNSKKPFIALILISFLYGILHAAGPGHGKAVTFSYFLSRREHIKKGILLGNLISFFHALSAVVIVLTIYFILKQSCLASFENLSRKIKLISYSLITLIGAVLLVKSILDLRKDNQHAEEKDLSAHPLDHKSILPVALAVGMVPCPGVVIIMLFSLSLNMLGIGLVSSFFMALGMAFTISLAGVLSIVAKEGILKALSQKKGARMLVQKGLTTCGSLLILSFGIFLLILSL